MIIDLFILIIFLLCFKFSRLDSRCKILFDHRSGKFISWDFESLNKHLEEFPFFLIKLIKLSFKFTKIKGKCLFLLKIKNLENPAAFRLIFP
jgi:hypothetical protein